jgi:tetratricopeptide (TPR) repeat protein
MSNTNKSQTQDTQSILERVSVYRQKKKYSQAESLLLDFLSVHPKSSECVHQLMQIQWSLGKGSVEFLFSYARRCPQYLVLQRDVAAMLLELGETEKSLEKIAQNFEVFGASPELWTDYGVIFRHKGYRNKAEIKFQHAISMNCKTGYSWFNWANLHMDEGRYAQAEQLYLRAIRIDGQNLEFWIQLIFSAIAREEFLVALRFVSEAKRRVGELATLFYMQALILYNQKKTKEAKWAIHQALQNGNRPMFWELLICLLQEDNLDTTEAEKCLLNIRVV